jgi:hypothetical protein
MGGAAMQAPTDQDDVPEGDAVLQDESVKAVAVAVPEEEQAVALEYEDVEAPLKAKVHVPRGSKSGLETPSPRMEVAAAVVQALSV